MNRLARLTRGLLISLMLPLSAIAADLQDDIRTLQLDWEVIRYQTPSSDKANRFEALAARSRAVSERYAGRSEPLIWEGIILSSLAGEKGGLGALGLVKRAKVLYEQAIETDGAALEGSAYNSLGVLYYKVPGWPLGFGDKDKAGELLRKALSINPDGLDSNFFYAEYLVEIKKPAEAMTHLERALKAPDRPGRNIADTGRREEVRALIARLKAS